MNPPLPWRWHQCFLLSIGFQVSIAVASELGPFPFAKPPTSCYVVSNTATATKKFAVVPAFATTQSRRSNRNEGSVRPTLASSLSFSLRSPCHRPSSRLLMLSQDNRELVSVLASMSFWPALSYINEVVTWILGLSLIFVATSLLLSKSSEDSGRQLAIVAGGVDVNETNEALLTPGTYADSNSAERLVTDTVFAKAPEAFDSTDFTNDPHLSPELEDAEAAFEIALLANAAHAMADAAEKENRQSKAAMLEREKELDWIEHHDKNKSNMEMIVTRRNMETFQRSLLAAQLANKSTGRARKQEAFQRSLLSSRIAYEVRAKEIISKVEREISSTSLGDEDYLQFDYTSAAAVEAANEKHDNDMDGGEIAGHITADSVESIILGDDPVFVEYTQPSEEALQVEANDDSLQGDVAQILVQEAEFSAQNQLGNDSVQEVRKYIHQKAIEKTKQKMSLRNIDVDGIAPSNDAVDTITTSDAALFEEISVKENTSGSNSVMKLIHKHGLIRRMTRRRSLLVAALVLVISR